MGYLRKVPKHVDPMFKKRQAKSMFSFSVQFQVPSQNRFMTEMKGKRWHPRSTCEAQNTCKNAWCWHVFGCCCIDRRVLSHQSGSDLTSMVQLQQNSVLCTTPTQNWCFDASRGCIWHQCVLKSNDCKSNLIGKIQQNHDIYTINALP